MAGLREHVPEAGLRFGVLGRLEVVRDGEPVPIGSAKARALLAMLLLHPNEVVSVDALVERMWDGDGPQNAKAALQTHVTRLRAALGADCLRTRANGYTVAADAGALDLLRFEQLVAEADDAGAEDARELLREALGLWRGEPLSNVDSDALHQQDVAPLLERRLAVTARRAELDLSLGGHADLTAELRRLTTLHPHREGLWALFMRALYGAGRQAEALQAYRDVRRLLADDLGIEPGPDLRRLHQRMLSGEDMTAATPTRTAPNTLPRGLPDFTGRAELLALITSAAENADGTAPPITAIDGMAGIGKTSLAVHAAHLLASRFPHGRLYLDLHGFTAGRQPVEPFDALGTLLMSLGIPSEQLPDDLDNRIARWRAEMNDRKAVVILDNAATAAQLIPLLPAAPDSLILVTGRKRLTGLDGVRPVTVGVLSPADAITLFHQVSRRIGEPSDAAKVVALCGYLPLAIRIAAARLVHRPSWTVGALAQRLRDGTRRLAELAVDDRGVAAAFGVSYDQLSDLAKLVFRRLGLMPCADLDSHGVAAIAGVDLHAAESALDELVDAHLVQEATRGGSVRFTFHDLLRDYARDRAASEEDTDAALLRLFDYYTCCLYHADAAFAPEEARDFPASVRERPRNRPALDDLACAIAWFDAERAILREMAHAALDHGSHDHATDIAILTTKYLHMRHFTDDDIDMQMTAVAAAERAGDRARTAQRLNNLGSALDDAGRCGDALDTYRRALRVFRDMGDLKWSSMVLGNIACALTTLGQAREAVAAAEESLALAERAEVPRYMAYALHHMSSALADLGEHAAAETASRRALALFTDVGDEHSRAVVEGALARIIGRQGRHREALALVRRGSAALRARGDQTNLIECLNTEGEILAQAGASDDALDLFCEVVDLCRQINFPLEEARGLEGMAVVLGASHQAGAREHWRQAVALYERLGVPDQARARAGLAATGLMSAAG